MKIGESKGGVPSGMQGQPFEVPNILASMDRVKMLEAQLRCEQHEHAISRRIAESLAASTRLPGDTVELPWLDEPIEAVSDELDPSWFDWALRRLARLRSWKTRLFRL